MHLLQKMWASNTEWINLLPLTVLCSTSPLPPYHPLCCAVLCSMSPLPPYHPTTHCAVLNVTTTTRHAVLKVTTTTRCAVLNVTTPPTVLCSTSPLHPPCCAQRHHSTHRAVLNVTTPPTVLCSTSPLHPPCRAQHHHHHIYVLAQRDVIAH